MNILHDKGKVRSVKRKGSWGTERAECLPVLLTLLVPCVVMSQAALLSCSSASHPEKGQLAHGKLSTSLSVNLSRGNITCKKTNYFHNTFWLVLKFVKCMQARISSPPRVDEDEVCVAIYELCIVQIVLSHNLQTTIFYPSANFVVIYRAVSCHPHGYQL